jgi:hypothetical protein
MYGWIVASPGVGGAALPSCERTAASEASGDDEFSCDGFIFYRHSGHQIARITIINIKCLSGTAGGIRTTDLLIHSQAL